MATPPPDPALADPMLRIVRERHPDADVVLLPPSRPLLDRPAATPAQCRARQRHAGRVLGALIDLLDREPTARADYWWSQGHPEVRRWVTSAAFADLDEGAVPCLRGLADELVRLGWDPRPAADGSPRVRGAAGPLELIAAAEGGAVTVTLRSDPLHVPAEVFAQVTTPPEAERAPAPVPRQAPGPQREGGA